VSYGIKELVALMVCWYGKYKNFFINNKQTVSILPYKKESRVLIPGSSTQSVDQVSHRTANINKKPRYIVPGLPVNNQRKHVNMNQKQS
jgi:hypothetical protein